MDREQTGGYVRRNADRGTAEYAAFVRRSINALSKRTGQGDIAALGELDALRKGLDEAMTNCVVSLREEGYSWAEIAKVLGVTAAAVRQRFPEGKGVGRKAGGQPTVLR